MKDNFVWYVDAVRSKNGHQSNHVATVVVTRGFMLDGRPYFRVGVAVKHQHDRLPFVKAEGRLLATDRAKLSDPFFSIPDVCRQITRLLVKDIKNQDVLFSIDGKYLLSRVKFVLEKFSRRRDETNT